MLEEFRSLTKEQPKFAFPKKYAKAIDKSRERESMLSVMINHNNPAELRAQNIDTIKEAHAWLMSDPDNYEGRDTGKAHRVQIEASNDPNTTYAPKGIYFAQTQTFNHAGLQIWGSDLKLVNHADPESFHDYLPIRDYGSEKGQVYVDEMNREGSPFTDERLARMALNATELMTKR